MSESNLEQRIDACRADFQKERGVPFKHFFCPILHRDEPVELCRAHVVNEKFESCREWVPQRKDVDNFYGAAVEADFVSITRDRQKNSLEIWFDTDLRRKHRPK